MATEQEILTRLRAARDPAPAPAAEPEPAAPASEPSEPRAETPAPEPAPTPQPEPEPAAAAQTGEPGEGEDDDGVAIESLDDLSSYLGVERDQLYQLRIPMTDAEGKRVELTLGEWKDGYIASETSQRRAQEYERLTAQLREEQQRHQHEAHTRLQSLQATLDAVERQALAGYEDATLERMRAEGDPEYGTRLAERMRREQQLAEARKTAETQAQTLREEHQRRQQTLMHERLTHERQALLTLPEFREWRDEARYTEGAQRLTRYAQSLGFREEELGGLDHRALRVLEKARLHDERQAKGAAAAKQVIRVGKKVAKPGAAHTQSRQRSTEVESARKRLRSSGGIDDAVGLLRARRNARQ